MSGSCVAMAGMTLRMRVSRRSFTGRFVVYIQSSRGGVCKRVRLLQAESDYSLRYGLRVLKASERVPLSR